MCGAVKPLFVLPFYFLRLLQGWKSLNQSKRAAAPVDEFHQLCDSPISMHNKKSVPSSLMEYGTDFFMCYALPYLLFDQ